MYVLVCLYCWCPAHEHGAAQVLQQRSIGPCVSLLLVLCAHGMGALAVLTWMFLCCLLLQLEVERKLRALLTKEKERAEEESALAMGLCTGGLMFP